MDRLFSSEPARLLSDVIVEAFDDHGPEFREEHVIAMQYRIWKETGINMRPEILTEWHSLYFKKECR